MSFIDVRFHFTEVIEDDYTHYDLRSVQRTCSNIPAEAMQGIGETLAQSDHWNVGGVGATLDAMCDPDERERSLKDFW